MHRVQFESLENRQLLSCVIDPHGHGTKAVTATTVGQIMNMQVWAISSTHRATAATMDLISVQGVRF